MRLVAVVVLASLSLAPVGSADVPAALEAGAREVTLVTSKAPVVYGSGFILSGSVTTGTGASDECVSGVDVLIVREPFDDSLGWYEVVRVKTRKGGSFRAGLMAENSAYYRAEVQETPLGCSQARSKRVVVRSRLDVTLSPTTTSVERGGMVRLVAKVSPVCEGPVSLFKLVDGELTRVASKAPNDNCAAVFRRRVRDDSVFRAGHPELMGPGFFYLGNRSDLAAVAVRD